jgi:hypothetical protein
MAAKKRMQVLTTQAGARTETSQGLWSQIGILEEAFGTDELVRDFEGWLGDNSDKEYPISAYLRVATSRLSSQNSLDKASRNPEVTDLLREFSYLSDNKVSFREEHKNDLSGLLEMYSKNELIAAFKSFISDKDLGDPYGLRFIARDYLAAADGIAYATRRWKQEAEQAKTERDAAVLRLQAEAEAERQEAARRQQEEAQSFDPLSDG